MYHKSFLLINHTLLIFHVKSSDTKSKGYFLSSSKWCTYFFKYPSSNANNSNFGIDLWYHLGFQRSFLVICFWHKFLKIGCSHLRQLEQDPLGNGWQVVRTNWNTRHVTFCCFDTEELHRWVEFSRKEGAGRLVGRAVRWCGARGSHITTCIKAIVTISS